MALPKDYGGKVPRVEGYAGIPGWKPDWPYKPDKKTAGDLYMANWWAGVKLDKKIERLQARVAWCKALIVRFEAELAALRVEKEKNRITNNHWSWEMIAAGDREEAARKGRK